MNEKKNGERMKKTPKGIVKEILRRHPQYTADDIIRRIDNFDIVSFDVFDTLVNRDIPSPHSIFNLVAQDCLLNEEDINLFREFRIKAERKARITESNSEEVDLNKIYECIDERYKLFTDDLRRAEIKEELDITYPNPVIKYVYNWCRKNNKRIILISDMYLDRETIKKILIKCGYDNYEKLYISSETGLQKATGNLFKYVKNELELDTDRWVHIGDSIKGDYFGAKKNKVATVRIATNPSRTLLLRRTDLKEDFWNSIDTVLSGRLTGNESYYYRYGFEVLSPFLCAFSVWLHDNAKKKGVKKLFFLARDGFLLQKVYVRMMGRDALPNSYLYVSRRALRIPVLYTCEKLEDFISFIPKNKYLSRKEVFDLFGLEEEDKNAWIDAGFDIDENVFTNTIVNNEKFERFYKKIEGKCKQKSKEAYSAYLEYLKINNFVGDVGIVDIGWAGTIQRCINRIIPSMEENVNISAFYVGLTEDAERTLEGNGYIPSSLKPQVATAGLFEYPFLAQEGSLKKIDYLYGKISPIVGEYEYKDDEKNQNNINEMQKGVIDGVEILRKNNRLWNNVSAKDAYRALYRLTKKPTLKEAKVFGDMNFYDGASYPLARPQNAIKYIFKPKLFLKDFSDSGWKVGFMRRMFKVSFPYAKILEMAKKS